MNRKTHRFLDSGDTQRTGPPTPDDVKPPFSIFVLWHPSNAEGAPLAEALHEWFGGSAIDVNLSGQAIPVHFRSKPWTAEIALPAVEEVPEVDRPPAPLAVAEEIEDSLERSRAPLHNAARRPVSIHEAKVTVFVILVDDHLVNDPSWQRDLIEIAAMYERQQQPGGEGPTAPATPLIDASPRVLPIGVQLTSALLRLPNVFSRLQSVRLDRWDEDEQAPLRTRQQRLGRLVAQALVRLLKDDRDHDVLTRAFLSHAKADGEHGPGVAERLRKAVASYGQIDPAFYDESSLVTNAHWRQQLQDAARQSGFVAVLSDRYASRYWCRLEVEMARTPQQLYPHDSAELGEVNVWGIQPTVVVSTLQGEWSRLVPDLGLAPAQSWSEGLAEGVLDRLMLESLQSVFQRRYAAQLCSVLEALRQEDRIKLLSCADPDAGGDDGLQIHLLTWTPDPASLLRLEQPTAQHEGWRLYVYPGHGFLPTEENTIKNSLRRTELVSYSELLDRIRALNREPLPEEGRCLPMAERPFVQLSAGDGTDLDELGYHLPAGDQAGNSIHVDLVAIRLCRALLRGHARSHHAVRLLYGGAIRKGLGNGYFEMLQDAAIAARMDPQEQSDPSPDPATPLEALLPWPFHSQTTVSDRAGLHGLCRFRDVRPPMPHGKRPQACDDATPAERSMLTGLALTRLRGHLAKRSEMMIALAGKIVGWQGCLPGIAEEVLSHTERALAIEPLDDYPQGPLDDELEKEFTNQACHLDAKEVRIILLGEYGGMARQLVRAILEPDVPDAVVQCQDEEEVLRMIMQASEHSAWRWLCLAHHKTLAENQPLAKWLSSASVGQRAWLSQRYRLMRASVWGLRQVFRSKDSEQRELEHLGMRLADWRALMITRSPSEITRIVSEALPWARFWVTAS